jgi:hypothetical protein
MREHTPQTGRFDSLFHDRRGPLTPLTGAIATMVRQPAKIINIVRLHRTAKM